MDLTVVIFPTIDHRPFLLLLERKSAPRPGAKGHLPGPTVVSVPAHWAVVHWGKKDKEDKKILL